MFIADNLSQFRTLFSEKLISMLSPDELGAYILVLANSIQDDALRDSLNDALCTNKDNLKLAIENQLLTATQDDLDVFSKLETMSTLELPSWERHNVGVWNVMCNPFRALRPKRSSSEAVKNIQKDFNSDTFNFNKPFLKPEILWEGEQEVDGDSNTVTLRVLYNKFPFIAYHTIIAPNPESELPQYLTKQYHDMIWQLVQETHVNLPGFGAGYNSLGACASVNHLHFQGFIQSDALPIELKQWKHNGGDIQYPMSCLAIHNKEQAWESILAMHSQNAPYNILYRDNCCYLIPRQLQGSAAVNESVAGAGWIEECGVIVAANLNEIKSLNEEVIVNNLKSLSAHFH